MKREYANTNELVTADFFYGNEVEKTSMYGKPTLFVVGLKSADEVQQYVKQVSHIFFGANHSFNPENDTEAKQWNDLIQHFINLGYYCSLDIPVSCIDKLASMPVAEHNWFVPQIRVPIPNAVKMNYRTTIKIDDIGFNQTNPGVWVHQLHDLLTRNRFTDWSNYNGDEVAE